MSDSSDFNLAPISPKRNLEQAGRSTMADQVERQLRDKIINREFSPNLKLPSETQMAEIFSVSRATVREAICRLEQSGLVHVRHGTRGGVYIRDVTFEPFSESLSMMLQLKKTSMTELLEARSMFETWATELAAARATEQDIEKLRASLAELESVISGGEDGFEIDAFSEANLKFHVGVAEAAKNNVLLITMRAVRDLLADVFKSTGLDYQGTKDVPQVHRRILAAISARDPLSARQRMHEHLLDFEEWLVSRQKR